MAYRIASVNFSKGELAPVLYGRVDVSAYSSAAKQARNVVVMPYGGLTRRMGLEFVGEVRDSTQVVRLISFQFSIDQGYALEFGQGTMRPVAYGGQVVEEELRVTGMTNGSPIVVTVPYHGFATGDDVYLSGILGMVQVNGRVFRVTVIDANTFSLNNVSGVGYGVFAGAPDGTLRTSAPTPPDPAPVVPPVVAPPAPPVIVRPGGGGRQPNPDEQNV